MSEHELSAAEFTSVDILRGAADDLAKTNGEPSCKEHRRSTVILLRGQAAHLVEMHDIKKTLNGLAANVASLASSMKRTSDTQTGLAVENATIEGMIMTALKSRAAGSSTAMWVAICIASPCVLGIVWLLKH